MLCCCYKLLLRRVAFTALLTPHTLHASSRRSRPASTRMASFPPKCPPSLGSPSGDSSEFDGMFVALAAYTGDAGATTTAEERAEAAAMRSGGSDPSSSNTEEQKLLRAPDFPPAKIDEGTFKYVLIAASPPGGGAIQHLVRGDLRAEYHKDAAQPTVRMLESMVRFPSLRFW